MQQYGYYGQDEELEEDDEQDATRYTVADVEAMRRNGQYAEAEALLAEGRVDFPRSPYGEDRGRQSGQHSPASSADPKWEAGWARFLKDRGIDEDAMDPGDEWNALLDEFNSIHWGRYEEERALQKASSNVRESIREHERKLAHERQRMEESRKRGDRAGHDAALKESALLSHELDELRASVPFAIFDDQRLPVALEDARVASEEAAEEVARFPRGSVRRERAERQATDLEGKVAELAEEVRRRATNAGSETIRRELIEREATRAVAADERRRVALLRAQRRPEWEIAKAVEEAGDRDRLAPLVEAKKAAIAPRLDQDHRRKMGELLNLGA